MSKRQVLIALGVISVVLFVGGMYAAWRSRHDTICPNGKPPVAQQDDEMGQVLYLCTNGVTVTN